MKKLMLAAAIVCAAVMSQGAAVYWFGEEQVIAGYTGGSGDSVSGLAYLLSESVLAYDSAIAYAADGDFASIIAKAYENEEGVGVTLDAGSFEAQTLAGDFSAENYYALFVEEGGDWAYLSSTVEIEEIAGKGSTDLAFEDEYDRSAAGTGWYAAASVPEPTSGLLMLLGMAGLALRRRRA